MRTSNSHIDMPSECELFVMSGIQQNDQIKLQKNFDKQQAKHD